MSQARWSTLALSILIYASGAGAASAQDKHKKEEAARHAAEKAEHERKEREKAEHERKEREKAEHERKMKQEKAEHERKEREEAARRAEHERQAKAASEARIAAARKARETNPPQKARQTAKDRQIAGTLSLVAVNLHRADHDYDWQRHEAVELIRGALHALHEPEPNTYGHFGGVTQKQSDQILRENIPVLESLKTELSASGAPAHHQQARIKVEEALSNLHAAPRIR